MRISFELDRRSSLALFCCGCVAAIGIGCAHKCGSLAAEAAGKRVAVAYIGWDLREQQEELAQLLERYGIDMGLDGSRRLAITVPAERAGLALELLRTNHLVLEQKVHLLE